MARENVQIAFLKLPALISLITLAWSVVFLVKQLNIKNAVLGKKYDLSVNFIGPKEIQKLNKQNQNLEEEPPHQLFMIWHLIRRQLFWHVVVVTELSIFLTLIMMNKQEKIQNHY